MLKSFELVLRGIPLFGERSENSLVFDIRFISSPRRPSENLSFKSYLNSLRFAQGRIPLQFAVVRIPRPFVSDSICLYFTLVSIPQH